MKLRFAAPSVVIDLGGIVGLRRVTAGNETITIGALATHYAVESHRLLGSKCALLPETASEIGDVQVRNRGTVGGSVVHGDPAADWPAAILALNASLDIAGPNGERTVSASDFFVDLLTTALQPGEILTQIVIPTPPAGSGGAYVKMHQSASGFAIAGVAAQVSLDGNGACASVGVGITGVSSVPYRAGAVEDALRGQTPDSAAIQAASERATDGLDPDDLQSDHHASGDYRVHLAKVFTRRALTQAVERAG
jgi:carbon-monoxide dehydrogenase medium subunit